MGDITPDDIKPKPNQFQNDIHNVVQGIRSAFQHGAFNHMPIEHVVIILNSAINLSENHAIKP